MDGGRTDVWVADRRMAFKKRFSAFLSHIRVLSKRIKRGYGSKNIFQHVLSHIRVLSKRVKRGYGSANFFGPF
jgi:hypothetical protein